MDIPRNCKECKESYIISIPPLWQRYCDIVGDAVSHKTRKRHPKCPYNKKGEEDGFENNDR